MSRGGGTDAWARSGHRYSTFCRIGLCISTAPCARDHNTVIRELNEFVLPYIAIRNRDRGYAVSIVKAGMTVIGRTAGPVRPPLTDLTQGERTELQSLIEKLEARRLVNGRPG